MKERVGLFTEHRGRLMSLREFSAEPAYLVMPSGYPAARLAPARLAPARLAPARLNTV